MATSKFISNKNETIRLFKNPVLEYFSHIHPLTPIAVYLPVVVVSFVMGVQQVKGFIIIPAFLFGLLLWTFVEYAFHRWIFHYEPTSLIGKRLHFLAHGIHHDYPKDATRLVMPLLISVPLAFFFFYLFKWMFASNNLAIFSGFVLGYLFYDNIHYATHHLKMKGRIGKFLRSYHMRHHFEDEHTGFGVSSPLWDFIFNTKPRYITSAGRSKFNHASTKKVLETN